MRTQYIKKSKSAKNFYLLNYREFHGPFWPGGGYAHDDISLNCLLFSRNVAKVNFSKSF